MSTAIIRPAGAVGVETLDPGTFPFDAWDLDYTDPAVPVLSLKAPWRFASLSVPRTLTLPLAAETSLTIAKADGYSSYRVTTGSSTDYTINLPLLTGRGGRIRFSKTDTGSKFVVLTASGSDKIGAKLVQTTFSLYGQGWWVELEDVGTHWAIVNLGSWDTAWTPTFSNFGSVSAVSFTVLRVANKARIMGKFTSGTTAVGEGRMALPFGLSSDSGLIPSIEVCGMFARSGAAASSIYCLIESNAPYITFGLQTAGTGALTKQTGGNILGNNEVGSLFCEVPLNTWNG